MKSIVESSSAELLQRMKGIEELVRQNSSSGPSSVPTNSSSYKMFHHPSDGKFRRVPPGWVFPKGALLNAYQYWHWGDEVNGVHPIKSLEPCDLEWSEGRHKKDLEELSFLCGKLDEEAKSKGILATNVDRTASSSIYFDCVSALGIPKYDGDGNAIGIAQRRAGVSAGDAGYTEQLGSIL